jgi:UDP-N-acetylglucosamine (GlcNAc):hydroxyproline polypeptide GlcNAc-transferase
MTPRLFVQLPAYRDRELPFTLADLFARARHPDRVRVAVAWQYGDDELHLEATLRRWKNVELLKIPAHTSEGCNWARRLLQQRWDGEPYTLLLDSHHRFSEGWDEQAMVMLESLRERSTKPILTGYLPPYDPHRDPEGRASFVTDMRHAERHAGLMFRLTGDPMPDKARPLAPWPARFASLHFLFADGSLNAELTIDPSLYFFVDEIAIALRAHTHGYDLFHPHRVLGWHLYDRGTRVTHWHDHDSWRRQNEISCRRVRALYRGRLRGKYGIGESRSVASYEALLGEPLMLEARVEHEG